MLKMSNRYLNIDEEGFISLEGVRVDDESVGRGLLERLQRAEKDRFVTTWDGQTVLVEAFDQPLVARHVERSGDQFHIVAPYGYRLPISLEKLCVDEWDRFHGLAGEEISFVLSRPAQMEFFDCLDEFDDDSITVGGRRYEIQPYYLSTPEIDDEKFWTKIYQTETPGWEIGEPAKPLEAILPQLKIPKSRVLVLGCGTGQDAAYFARQGHVVTGVDFSSEAISRARQTFGENDQLKFVAGDIFAAKLGTFDLIFEHACYAAIRPDRRSELIRLWRRHLAPGGHVLGIFFMMSKRGGPPFGNSEWELRQKLGKDFRFLYWTRWRHSIERRLGRELVVYAQALKSP